MNCSCLTTRIMDTVKKSKQFHPRFFQQDQTVAFCQSRVTWPAHESGSDPSTNYAHRGGALQVPTTDNLVACSTEII